MHDTRLTKVLRDLRLHKARTALVISAVVVGIIGTGTVLNTWALLKRVTRDGYLATNPPAAIVRLSAVDRDLLTNVRALPAVRAATVRQVVVGRMHRDERSYTAVLVSGDELATSAVGKVVSVGGAWPVTDHGVVIEQSSVEFSGLTIGDSVTLQVGDQPARTLPVVGIARDQGMAPGWMEHVVYAFVTPSTLSDLDSASRPFELRFTVTHDVLDRDANRRVAVDVVNMAKSRGTRVIDVDVPVPGEHVHAGQMNSLLYTQGAFGVLSLLLSAFLVVNLMTAMLSGHIREIGIMKAIGAQPTQLIRMYVVLALVLGMVSVAIAVPAAMVLGYWYADFGATLLNFDVTGTSLPIGVVAVQVIVGLLLPIVAAAVPVWRGCRISVNSALRDIGIPETSNRPHVPVESGVRFAAVWRRIPRPMLLSLRNAFRRRQRMALTLATLSIGGAVYLGALGLRASIRDSVSVLYDEQLRFDLSLRMSDAHPVDSLESIARGVGGVEDAESWGSIRVSLARPDNLPGIAFPISALPASSRLVNFPVVAGQWLAEDRPGDSLPVLVVNRRLQVNEPTMQVGQTITLIMDGVPVRALIGGVVESGTTPNAYLVRETLARLCRNDRVHTVMVATTSTTLEGQTEILDRVRDRFESLQIPVANAQLMQAGRASFEDHLLMVSGFLLVMSQLTIVIGGLGLASTMSLAVLERTREIGVMRAVGASHGAIIALVQFEGLVIGVCSWLLAIPLSLPVSILLARAFGRIMIPVPIHFTPDIMGLVLWFAVVVIVSLVASAWPARHATRISTASALAHD